MDFTSALYLGLGHGSGTLTWSELTTGTPAVLGRAPATIAAERAFAELTGCGRALALGSTLHAFVDLFAQLARASPPPAVFYDAAVYPVVRWGMERARLRGARVAAFPHHDPAALRRRLERLAGRARPWVVSDGFCPGCARLAPLDAYAALARRHGGGLIVDDTQAIGVLGAAPAPEAPLGRGGGGSLRRFGLSGEDVLLVASLAKAFGAPLAMIAGGVDAIAGFAARSETLVHCSPPSAANVAAAVRALTINAAEGEALRARLVDRVRTLRAAFRRRAIAPRGGWFPIQRVRVAGARAAAALASELARRGIRALVLRSRCAREISLTFLVTARHGEPSLEAAAAALALAARCRRGLTLEHPSTVEA